MPNNEIMPDLFLVMSDEELAEAIEFAKENDATVGDIYENITYRLIFDDVDASEYCSPNGSWFPMLTDYVVMHTTNNDTIAMLLSPTIWPDYSLEKVKATFDKHGLPFGHVYDPLVNVSIVSDIKEEEKNYSKENPINSPWTARDVDVAKTAIDTIESIKSATLITNTNIRLICFITMLNGRGGQDIPIARFNYPNILHLITDTSYHNVFLGSNIDLKELINYIESRSISTDIKQYSPELAKNILFKSRNRPKNL